jgi:hypothetical protein
MTHEELIKVLRSKNCCGDVCHCDAAADCIEQLVKERDDAEQREITKIEVNHRRVVGFLNRAKVAEANLAKAVEALRFYADVSNYDDGIVGTTHEAPVWSESDFTEFEWDNGQKARSVLDELEQTE